MVIDGPETGKLLHVCRDEKCPVHAKATRYQPSPQEHAESAKEALAERIEKLAGFRILNAIRKKLPPALSCPDLKLAARDYFERLGHENHRRVCRVYGWEVKKTKAAWGGSTVDYKGIAQKAVREMSTQELQHFLVVCALASDLYCPGYNPRQALARDSNLGQAAARCKIDTAKLSTMVREELSKRREGTSLKKNKTIKRKSK